MKVLLFDVSNLVIRALYANEVSPTEKDFLFFKRTFLSSLMKTIKENKPDKVIMVQDSESWRKEIYPEYKANRAVKRETSIVNFDIFFPIVDNFLNNLKKAFKNIQFIKLPKCEADDIIATIVKYKQDWDIITISSDKDFYQLYRYQNYTQYDGMKHEFIEVLNPEQDLLIKIIRGDKGDNIPCLKKGIGPVKAAAIINNDLNAWLIKENLQERFKENTKLISFDSIPVELQNNIIKELDSYTYEPIDEKYFFKFITNSGLPDLLLKYTEYIEIVKGLK